MVYSSSVFFLNEKNVAFPRKKQPISSGFSSLATWAKLFEVGLEIYIHFTGGFSREEILGEDDAMPQQMVGTEGLLLVFAALPAEVACKYVYKSYT